MPTVCGEGTDLEGQPCVSNVIVGISITCAFTLFFTVLFVALHFCAWSKYNRNKRLVQERVGSAKSADGSTTKKAVDPSVFYANYGAPLQAYGESN